MSQSAFTAALLAPDPQEPLGLTDGHGNAAGKRFCVYRNNVAISLIEALTENFPAVLTLLGPENFRNIAREFARAHPPSSPLLLEYGAKFAGFLEAFPPLARFPYLGDVARLEYGLRASYHAANAVPITPEALASVPPEDLGRLRLTLAPSTRLLRSCWPQLSLWRHSLEPDRPKPSPQAEDVLITRAEFDPEPHLVGPGAATCLAALQCGATLSEASDTATKQAENFDLSALITLLLNTQCITHASLEERP